MVMLMWSVNRHGYGRKWSWPIKETIPHFPGETEKIRGIVCQVNQKADG